MKRGKGAACSERKISQEEVKTQPEFFGYICQPQDKMMLSGKNNEMMLK